MRGELHATCEPSGQTGEGRSATHEATARREDSLASRRDARGNRSARAGNRGSDMAGKRCIYRADGNCRKPQLKITQSGRWKSERTQACVKVIPTAGQLGMTHPMYARATRIRLRSEADDTLVMPAKFTSITHQDFVGET